MDVSETTFELDVIDRSHDVPVVVDFWAAWCGPCRQLGPLIEDAVGRRDPDVVLAKVDIDANPGLAQRFQVMSIPAVKAFRDGKMVDEFVGLVSATQMEAFLDRLLPSQADRLVEQGDEDSLRDAIRREPGHVDARVALAHLLIDAGDMTGAADVLSPVEHDPVAVGLIARCRLTGSDIPDVQAGLAALAREDWEIAFGSLVDAVTASTDTALRNDVRAMLIGQFREMGDADPVVGEYRKRLARAFY
jgi:putative thioredoxin